jgi:hypothetical protein
MPQVHARGAAVGVDVDNRHYQIITIIIILLLLHVPIITGIDNSGPQGCKPQVNHDLCNIVCPSLGPSR